MNDESCFNSVNVKRFICALKIYTGKLKLLWERMLKNESFYFIFWNYGWSIFGSGFHSFEWIEFSSFGRPPLGSLENRYRGCQTRFWCWPSGIFNLNFHTGVGSLRKPSAVKLIFWKSVSLTTSTAFLHNKYFMMVSFREIVSCL